MENPALGIIRDLQIDSVTMITDSNLSPSSDARHVDSGQDIEVTQEEKLRQLTEKGITLRQNSLTADQLFKLADLLFQNLDLFATSMHDLVGTKVELMHIDTEDAKRIRQRPYRQSPEMQRQMERLIDAMLSSWLIFMFHTYGSMFDKCKKKLSSLQRLLRTTSANSQM